MPHVWKYRIEVRDRYGFLIFAGDQYGEAKFGLPEGVLFYNNWYKWRVKAFYEEWYYPEIETDWSDYSWFKTADDFYVNNYPGIGNDNFDGLAPLPDPDIENRGPKRTIQAAINDIDAEGYNIYVAGMELPIPLPEIPQFPDIPGHYSGFNAEKPVSIIGQGEMIPGEEIFSGVFIHSDVESLGAIPGFPPIIESWSPAQVSIQNCNLVTHFSFNFGFSTYLAEIYGPGNVVATNCMFVDEFAPFTYMPLLDCQSVQNKVYDARDPVMPPFNQPAGPGKFYFNIPPCAPHQDNLLLHLDPTGLFQLDGDPVAIWPDNTLIPENAGMDEEDRQPSMSRMVNDGGILGFPAVDFDVDYGMYKYGYSDVMTGPETVIGTDEYLTANNTDRWEFDYEPKSRSLLAVFQTPQFMNEDKDGNRVPYYADGRQSIVEIGGPLSGMNCYLYNGKICGGMWNRAQKTFALYDPQDQAVPFYPLDFNEVYLYHLEYDGDNEQFRIILSTTDDGIVSPKATPWLPMAGLSLDDTYYEQYGHYDMYAVGGASRTRYHDYSIGESYSDHFGGKVGDVMLYAISTGVYDIDPQGYVESFFDVTYDFLNDRYDDFGVLAGASYPSLKMNAEEWKIFNFVTTDNDQAEISDAVPNPFSDKTAIGIYMNIPGRIIVDLYDAAGNKVQSVFDGNLGKGFSTVEIDGSGLSNGMYIFRITGNDFVKSGKLILNK